MKRTVLAVVLIVVLAVTLMSAFAQRRGGPDRRGGGGGGPDRRGERVEKARDPVCHIMVEKDPNLSARYGGQVYYFCSKKDMEEFKREPQRYVGRR